MTNDQTPPTLAEILAACEAVQAIYAARDAAAAGPIVPPGRTDCPPTAPELEPADP
jgi:hypothetical protein